MKALNCFQDDSFISHASSNRTEANSSPPALVLSGAKNENNCVASTIAGMILT